MTNPNEFPTKDLRMAATLQTLGHKIIRLDPHPTDPETRFFVFENVPNLNTIWEEDRGKTPQEDSQRYIARKTKVEPNALFANNDTLREWAKSDVSLNSK